MQEVHRPWGYFQSLDLGAGYQVKKLVVYPNQRLSLQSHEHRAEQWIVVEGKAVVTIGDAEAVLKTQEKVFIPAHTKHRLSNHSEVNLTILEIQFGDYLGEDDIIRYDDDYGRE